MFEACSRACLNLCPGLPTRRHAFYMMINTYSYYILFYLTLVVNGCSQVWLGACRELGGCIPDNGGPQDGRHWKGVYVHASQRLRQLHSGKAFETSVLMGHSARVYALYYRNGLLCTGSDDLSAKLWDVKTGQCIYGIQTHTCADIKFDEHKLLTASFDNTLACWDWATCTKTKHFLGHTAAGFSFHK
uniref:Uncharacterized protein n=1 Tax=Eptatretus burgeri TaxID=7764 RepID=A0A8C4NC70_EPTBU